jgi:hypothetical protein
MPAAFSVAGSPITSSGTLAVTGAGSNAQFVDGTGALQTIANLPFIDGTGIANRVPFFVDADTISSSGLTYTTTGGGSAGNLPLFNFSSAGNADINTQRVIAIDYFGSTLNIDNIVAGNSGTVSLNGNTVIGNAGTDTLTVNAAATFTDNITMNGASKNLTLGVTNPIIFLDGTGTERLRIAGDISNNSIIQDSSPGDLMLFSNTELEIKSGITGENFAKFTKDGPIELYYDNVKKFETTTTGITVTGTQSSFSGQVTIPTTPVASTDAASKAYVDSQVGYSTYVARVTQSGTNAPVATVISNNTGLTFTWIRQGTGSYRVSPSSAFVINKTWIQMTGGDVSSGTTSVSIKDIGTAFASAVNVNLVNGNVADNITAAFVEIRIYP